jgi:hypothetical protein
MIPAKVVAISVKLAIAQAMIKYFQVILFSSICSKSARV